MAASFDLDVIKRCDSPEKWAQTLSKFSYIPVSYMDVMISYQEEYSKNNMDECHDLSMIILNDNKPVALWPIDLWKEKDGWRIGSTGGPVLPPRFINDLGKSAEKRILRSCISYLNDICITCNVNTWQSVDTLLPEGVGSWQKRALENGAESQVTSELFIDMSMDLKAIRANIRKSYRPLITKAERLWEAEVIDQDKPEVWEEFKQLHAHVAGRITRSDETWVWQKKAVDQGEAFLVVLRDDNKVLVGCGLFYLSRDEGLYAVGAYERILFDKPLGHLVQWKAIEYMKQKGVRWYRIGARPYPGDDPAPNEKEVAIGYFKEGFATHTFMRLTTTSCINKGEQDLISGSQEIGSN